MSEVHAAEQSSKALPISAQQAQRHVNFLLEMGLPVLWHRRQNLAEESAIEAQQDLSQVQAASLAMAQAALTRGESGVARPQAENAPAKSSDAVAVELASPAAQAAKQASKEANVAPASAWDVDFQEISRPPSIANQAPITNSLEHSLPHATHIDADLEMDAEAQQRAAAIANMDWMQLEQAVNKCHACALVRKRTQAVFGVGDKRPSYLLIGEGPGRTEDALGEPFVGKSGKLLDNMLASLDVARGKGVYIANIVKCRPTDVSGNDRAPSAEEAASCRPFLKRQIALLQPELVLALGKTAAVSLLAANPETAVSSLRGSVRAISASYAGEREIPMVVSYHPAYLLRKPQDKARAWADLCLARSRLQARGAK